GSSRGEEPLERDKPSRGEAPEAHYLADLGHGARCNRSRLRGALAERATHLVGSERLALFSERNELALEALHQHLLAVDAPPLCTRAVCMHLVLRLLRRERFVHREDVADLGAPGVALLQALRIGVRDAELFPERLLRLEEPDGVALRLGHLRQAVDPHDA